MVRLLLVASPSAKDSNPGVPAFDWRQICIAMPTSACHTHNTSRVNADGPVTRLAGTSGKDKPLRLKAGDILLLPGNPRHVMHDGSGTRAKPARNRPELNLVISENVGSGDRLDLLCGHFAIAPPHDRLLRSYLPPRLVVHVRGQNGGENAAQLAGLVALLRGESGTIASAVARC
jgi:hypothetical protein